MPGKQRFLIRKKHELNQKLCRPCRSPWLTFSDAPQKITYYSAVRMFESGFIEFIGFLEFSEFINANFYPFTTSTTLVRSALETFLRNKIKSVYSAAQYLFLWIENERVQMI